MTAYGLKRLRFWLGAFLGLLAALAVTAGAWLFVPPCLPFQLVSLPLRPTAVEMVRLYASGVETRLIAEWPAHEVINRRVDVGPGIGDGHWRVEYRNASDQTVRTIDFGYFTSRWWGEGVALVVSEDRIEPVFLPPLSISAPAPWGTITDGLHMMRCWPGRPRAA